MKGILELETSSTDGFTSESIPKRTAPLIEALGLLKKHLIITFKCIEMFTLYVIHSLLSSYGNRAPFQRIVGIFNQYLVYMSMNVLIQQALVQQ